MWQPIETAPYGMILGCIQFDGGGRAVMLMCKDEDNWIDDGGGTIYSKVTHWHPLPDLPEPK